MTDERLTELLALVSPVGAAFAAAGHQAYLVGGLVRDHLLGRELAPDTDFDLTTDAPPPVIRTVVEPLADAVWTQGERFGTIGCRIDGRVYEITTHRAERYSLDSRKPDVDFSTDVTDDLSRRDFTVNAMARRLPDGELVDPFDGRGDLAARRLVTPLEPTLSFTDDPLRMMRAARFAATYDLEVEAGVVDAISALVDRLDIVSAERVREELVRLLEAPDPSAGVELLVTTGLVDRVLPELRGFGAGRLTALDAGPLARLARVLVDAGAEGARSRLRRLRFANDDVDAVAAMVGAVAGLDTLGDEDIRRFIVRAADRLDEAVAVAESQAGWEPGAVRAAVRAMVDAEGTVGFGPPIGGGELIERLGLEPGPVVGEAITWLTDQRLAQGPMSRDEAATRAAAWLAEHHRGSR